ncbi:MAG: LamG domain-containing protein [Gammaproteobacteria bacterium]
MLIAGGLAIWLWPSGGEDGLIAYWRCDEGSGDTLSDSADGANHGTLVNDPVWVKKGKLGGALRFDGSNYVQIPNAKVLELGSNGADFSVTFWMNLRQGWTGTWRSIMHKGNADTERTFAMWMNPANNSVHYRISTDADPNEGGYASVSQIDMNSWTHIAYVKKGKELQLYIDGNLDPEAPKVGNSMSNKGSLYLGKDPWWPGMNGSLDDIRIYDRALPPEVLRVLAEGESQ